MFYNDILKLLDLFTSIYVRGFIFIYSDVILKVRSM